MSWRLNILHHMSESYEALSELHAREERKKKEKEILEGDLSHC